MLGPGMERIKRQKGLARACEMRDDWGVGRMMSELLNGLCTYNSMNRKCLTKHTLHTLQSAIYHPVETKVLSHFV